ncbi:MAG: hypothetical protein PWP51_36 [Clostridiales bacterium]|nr:hypothetical protein [Clostridiales bacterium]MDN5297483.1 hypothetical protein [Clostridiales bacterium]
MNQEKNSAVKRHNWVDISIVVIIAALASFHLYTASVGILPSYAQASVHWALVSAYILLTKPLKFKFGRLIDLAIIAVNVYLTYYQMVIQEDMIFRAGIYYKYEIVLSVIALLIALEVSRRVIGFILPIISVLFLSYALLGSHLSGLFKTVSFSISRIAPYLYTSTDGLFGQTLLVSAQFIFLFVLFGTILDMTGAGSFFVDMSFSLTGRARGGPAQAAIYSSMLMGTINGSGAANVVTTGTFTIPLMKKVGFKPSMSGAIEAVASSGGQIMPPVMGAVAFLMSEITGIEYATIAMASLIPAVLYYLTLSSGVYLTARRDHIPAIPKEELADFFQTLKSGWLYFLPLVMLIALLFKGYSPQRSAFGAIIATLVVGFIVNRANMTFANFITALKKAANGIAPIASACILAGIIMGVINLTGLGLKISGIIEGIAAGRLLIALILAMLTSLLLGMGLPTSAAYMILAVLVAPAVIKMGASTLSAHLFILYFGALSTITPPVALSTFAAAGIAEANIWKTGIDALKLAATGFIIPFVFVFNEELLLVGNGMQIAIAFITAMIGCLVLASSLIGWFGTKLSIVSRLLLLPCAIMLFMANPPILSIVGLVLSAVIIAGEFTIRKRMSAANAA